MENNCMFVNSRGLLKSCDLHSPNPKSSCNNDYKYLLNINNYSDGFSVYVCSELLGFFIDKILSKINKRFVLLSGDSDLTVPIEAINQNQFLTLLGSPFLIVWFAQNTNLYNNSKIIQMPIGLDYHTISNNPSCSWKLPEEGSLPKDQESILMNIPKRPFYERIPLIYVNFSFSSDTKNDRKSSLQKIPNHLLRINNDFTPRTKNWKLTSQYAFVLSPFGNGMDCHRTWEALCLGCIPIVRAPNFSKMFEDLPVLSVRDWREVSRELLDKTINDFKNRNFNYEKLKLDFWVNKINSYKNI
jgi:hypothetical protein